MSTDLLFEHFTTLATATNGIPKIRTLILNMAFNGQLGTYDEKDESANTIIEMIRIRNKYAQINEHLHDSLSIDKFVLPKNWIQLPLINILSALESGSRPSGGVKDIEFGIPSLGGEHLTSKGGFQFETIKFVPLDFYQKMTRGKITKNDILIVKDGATTGKVSLVRSDFPFNEACINEHVFLCRFFEEIFPPYAFYFLYSEIGQQRILANFKGSTQGGINQGFAEKTITPIAPFAEQKRIVEKVERLMALCDMLEARQQQERAGCLRLGTASLTALQNADSPEEFKRQWAQVCQAFEMIFDCPENVTTLRQTILQLAVQGRLVRQEPSEETPNVLFNRIKMRRKEKGRKSKSDFNNSKIDQDDALFPIPISWIWTTTGQLCECIVPNRNKPKSFSGNIPWVTLPNFDDSFNIDFSTVYLGLTDQEVEEYNARIVPKGSVVISCVGKFGIVGILSQDAVINQQLHAFLIPPEIHAKYFAYAVKTQKKFMDTNATSTTILYLNKTKCNNIPVPLPPLAEQHRIVAKVDALMALCDELEARLRERAALQGKFANAIVNQVAG